eukprot:TRINITY_DN34150_c0_g1_i1.p1 TRINITY_DN34150_c0_g1~~TRINITY_DN34150_c0_g1_i1.p1  ORF type:complete len:128 (-),score=1.86 TRINITY_DN34150_c0_g1_i1:70-453(-)
MMWDPSNGEILVQYKVRTSATRSRVRCRFDVSANKKFLTVGNIEGQVFVFRIDDGVQLARLKYKRMRDPITGCAFSPNEQHILVTSGSILWRWTFIHPDKIKEYNALEKRKKVAPKKAKGKKKDEDE